MSNVTKLIGNSLMKTGSLICGNRSDLKEVFEYLENRRWELEHELESVEAAKAILSALTKPIGSKIAKI